MASVTAAVSTALCMASWARPISAMGIGSVWLCRLPRRAAARFIGTVGEHLHRHPGFLRQISWKIAPVRPLVVYFWLALTLTTTPPPKMTLCGVSLIGKVGVGGVGIVGAEHKAVGQGLGLCSGRCGGSHSGCGRAHRAKSCCLRPPAGVLPTSSLSNIAQTGAQALSVSAAASKKPTGWWRRIPGHQCGGHEKLAVRPMRWGPGGCKAKGQGPRCPLLSRPAASASRSGKGGYPQPP